MCIPGFICVSYYLNRLFLYTIKGVFYDQMKNGMMKMLGMRDYIVYSKFFGYEHVFCADTSPVGSRLPQVCIRIGSIPCDRV